MARFEYYTVRAVSAEDAREKCAIRWGFVPLYVCNDDKRPGVWVCFKTRASAENFEAGFVTGQYTIG